MNTLLKRTREFIFAQQTSIVSSTLILAGMMLLSRLAGFMRYRILAGYFTKEELDIFLAAFRVPDLVFEILINGALSTTFIPFFIKFQRNREHQNAVISSVINIVLVSLGGFIIVLFLLLPWVMKLITPGFSGQKLQYVIEFGRILLIGQLPFLVLGNFLTGISQARKSFLLPAVAPIIYNIAIIICTLMFANGLFLQAPVLGVVIGALFFFLIQLPVIPRSHFEYRPVMTHMKETMHFFRTAIPRIFAIVVAQIDATVDLTLATLLGSGSYTIYYFAQHLQLLPVSLVGMAFGQASLPYLTDMYQEGKLDEFKKIVIDSMLNIFFLTIPAAVFFIFARTPIVRLFFGGVKFDWDATVWTAVTLSCFSLSLPFHSVYYFLTRCFYAFFDTRTPFYVSLFGIGLNAVLSVVFTLVLHLSVWSLALAFSIAITVHAVSLFYMLVVKIHGLDIATLIWESCKIGCASFLAAVPSYFTMKLLDGLIFDTSRTLNVSILLFVGGVMFVGLYFFTCWLIGVRELYLITKMILKAKEYQRRVVELYRGVE